MSATKTDQEQQNKQQHDSQQREQGQNPRKAEHGSHNVNDPQRNPNQDPTKQDQNTPKR